MVEFPLRSGVAATIDPKAAGQTPGGVPKPHAEHVPPEFGGPQVFGQPGQRSAGSPAGGRGLSIAATFCPAEVKDPFETTEWELRSATISGEGGNTLFEQKNVEMPAGWSQLATNVVVSKYFYGENNTPERESSVRQLIHRVTHTITEWGLADGYFATTQDAETFYRDLTWLCLHQHGSFNSPVWFNVGLHQQYGVTGAKCNWSWDKQTRTVYQPENSYEFPQGSACFIQSVNDNMEDIMELARSEAMLFKFGSGTGTDLSTLRSHREKLSGGGKPSGPLSFMRVYDQIAAVVKSGGKTRRAAKMQSIKVHHPDVLEFIECKWREEQKARVLIEKGGYDSNFNGEAYSSILFQNANLSVRLTDEFMRAVEEDQDWVTRWVTNPQQAGPTYKARFLLQRMAECAWNCGDPGVQYDTTINRWHTCPNSGRINASNPCSEYMFLDNTACNLASINLMKFRQEDGAFDVEGFQAACRLFLIAQEILVDHASYPTKRIAENSHLFRPLGLGYSNLGSVLMSSGLPYDSAAGRGICGAITALLHGAANLTSAELAAAVGPFEGYPINREPMLNVMRMHRQAVDRIEAECPVYLQQAAVRLWDQVVRQGEQHGFRNAQVTVLAPTGTISFMMDCDTTGIEPDIALVKYKQLAGGGMMKIVNNTVPFALKNLGYDEPTIKGITDYVNQKDTIEGAPGLRAEHLPVFDCAFEPRGGSRSIAWPAHVKMMAAAQPFLSGAISKTVNMPRNTTPAEIGDAYFEGWRLGLKALAVYRDGSKESQPLATSTEGDRTAAKAQAVPRRERLPDTRKSVTHKFNVAGHEGYITVGLYDDGRPGELFITMAKEGSTIGGLMDSFGTAVSMSLQYGVPLEVYIKKFSHTRFEPLGPTKNKEIPMAKSVVDYIFRWLGMNFIAGYREAALGLPPEGAGAQDDAETDRRPVTTKVDGPKSQPGLVANHSPASGESPAASQKSAAKPAPARGNSASSATTHVVSLHTTAGYLNGKSGETAASKSAVGNGHATLSLQATHKPATSNGETAALLERAGLQLAKREGTRNDQFASFQTDAPACDHCGSITVRNGNCYLCHNCGNSMGCS